MMELNENANEKRTGENEIPVYLNEYRKCMYIFGQTSKQIDKQTNERTIVAR